MFNRPFTTLNRITIEAVDCHMNYNNINGHLNITLEPNVPVYSNNTNADPLLPQVTIPQTQTVTLTPTATPSNSSTPMTNSTVITADKRKTDLTLNSIYSPDFVPVSPPQQDILQDLELSKSQDNTTVQQSPTFNSDFELSTYIKSPEFKEKLKTIKTPMKKEALAAVARDPQRAKDWILQIIDTYPDILDDTPNVPLQYIQTSQGQIQINQPDPSRMETMQNQQDEISSDIEEQVPENETAPKHLPPEYMEEDDDDEGNDTDHSSTIPASLSPESLEDAADCMISRVSPGPCLQDKPADQAHPHKILKSSHPPPDGAP